MNYSILTPEQKLEQLKPFLYDNVVLEHKPIITSGTGTGTGYRLDVSVVKDSKIELVHIADFKSIQDIADLLGFTYSKTYNIFNKKIKLRDTYVITKLD